MRLLNTQSWLMQEYISDDNIPEYAILSHTWELNQEVSFWEWQDREASRVHRKTGYKKIQRFRAQAAGDGFAWVWVDTCCIDKSSSAELSEAINAMFRWYRNAKACYVYLADVPTSSGTSAMASSRWFTRGWTLQELIATRDVRFFSSTWDFIDTKSNLCDLLTSITGINKYVLLGGDLETVSVSRRMSWASRRKTARVEDIAYCLLGIFDVNLPLIYGEGQKAFQRLQEAIMLKTHDQSLFAWGKPVEKASGVLTADQVFGLEDIRWESRADRRPILGLLADGPERFEGSSDIEPTHRFSHELRRTHPPVLVSGGVLIGLMKVPEQFFTAMHVDQPAISAPAVTHVVVLLCSIGGFGGNLVGLVLRDWGEGYAGRTPELLRLDLRVSSMRFKTMVHQWHIMKEGSLQLRNRDIIFRRLVTEFEVQAIKRQKDRVLAWDRMVWGKCDIFRLAAEAEGDEYIRYIFRISPNQQFAVTFRRLLGDAGPMGSLVVDVAPASIRPTDSEDGRKGMGVSKKSLKDPALSHSHTMKTPYDSWALEMKGSPGIYIRAERQAVGERGDAAVDVIDFFICPEGPDAQKAKKAIAMRIE